MNEVPPLHSMGSMGSYLPYFPTPAAYQQQPVIVEQASRQLPQKKPGKRSGPQKKLKNSEKERRRNLTLNTAFKWLLSQIPCIPKHSRVPKIKTLRLATSYIAYLTEVLNNGAEPDIGEFASIANAQLRQKNSYKAAVEAMQQGKDLEDLVRNFCSRWSSFRELQDNFNRICKNAVRVSVIELEFLSIS